ncbi:MAG TPA: hypothetical protein VF841_16360 [Anaeromyxobacter sp.]
MRLAWAERDGGDLLDLSGTGPAGEGLYLAVRPHAEAGYFRPLFVLAPGEEERELGDGVLGREHARDTLVKLAISELARRHGLPPATLHAEDGDPWAARTIAALWALLAAAPHTL